MPSKHNIEWSYAAEGLALPPLDLEAGAEALFAAWPSPGILLHRDSGLILRVNPAAEALLGYAPREAEGLPLAAILPGEEGAGPLPPGTGEGPVVWRARCRDGRSLWVELGVKPVSETLAIVGLSAQADRSTLAEALRTARARNEAFLDALPDLIFLLDRGGVFHDYHAPKGTPLAAPPEAFLGRPIDAVLQPDVAEAALRHIAMALELGEPQVFEYTLDAFPGLHYEARVVASGENEVLVIIRDVTARHRLEAGLRIQNDQLREVDRLKGNFVSVVSHELRTPLTSIVAYAEFLEDDPDGTLTPEQQGFVAQVQASAKRLRRLVDDLLEFGLLDSDSFRLACNEGDLADTLRRVIDGLRPLSDRKRIALEASGVDGAIWLLADGDRLEQVITNLLHNAIKFTPEGGRIRVAVESDEAGVRVAVADTGIGIPQGQQAQLFQKFFQVDPGLRRLHGGAGLGLAIAKALVEAHGGRIGVESTPEAGSTFWFWLPRRGCCGSC